MRAEHDAAQEPAVLHHQRLVQPELMLDRDDRLAGRGPPVYCSARSYVVWPASRGTSKKMRNVMRLTRTSKRTVAISRRMMNVITTCRPAARPARWPAGASPQTPSTAGRAAEPSPALCQSCAPADLT